jgi:cytochrome P450
MSALRGRSLVSRAGRRAQRLLASRKPTPPRPREDPLLRLSRDYSLWYDPFPLYEEMRARGPMYSPVPTHLVCTGYDEVLAALKHPHFLSEPTEDDEIGAGLSSDSIVKSNPPRHPELRGFMAKWFSPRTIEQLDAFVIKQCHDLLDPLMDKGELDVVQDYALPLAIKVIAQILGVPESYHARFHEVGDAAARMLDPFLPPEKLASARDASAEILDYFKDLYAERRRNPGDDLLSALLIAGDDNTKLTEMELLANAQFTFLAGYETTVGMIGSAVDMLLEEPDYWQAMGEDDALVANVVEETLRLEAPVQMALRRVDADVEFMGRPVAAETRVLAILAAANRDPAVFPDPARFDPWRDNANRHLSFVVGPHHCLGSSLARLEGAIALRTLRERMPEIRRAGPAVRRPNLVARGLLQLPVSFA